MPILVIVFSVTGLVFLLLMAHLLGGATVLGAARYHMVIARLLILWFTQCLIEVGQFDSPLPSNQPRGLRLSYSYWCFQVGTLEMKRLNLLRCQLEIIHWRPLICSHGVSLLMRQLTAPLGVPADAFYRY